MTLGRVPTALCALLFYSKGADLSVMLWGQVEEDGNLPSLLGCTLPAHPPESPGNMRPFSGLLFTPGEGIAVPP